MWNRFKTFDPWLFLVPLILMVISVTVIYTLTADTIGNSLYLRQVLFSVIGLVLMFICAFIDYRSLKGLTVWLYLLGLASLVAVKLVGKEDFGAQRWIELGFFQLQPGELEKWIIIIALSALLAKYSQRIRTGRFVLALLILIAPVVLVMLEPDLGTAIVLSTTGIGILLHANLTKKQTLVIIASSLMVVASLILSFQEVKPFNELLKDYQKKRLMSFVEPSKDVSGSGYNVLQSVIAVGSGGLTGKGLGFGSQSQLNFLPVAHADFIFAGIAEAWGLVGSLGILALYGILLSRLIQAARIARDDFGMLICVGIVVKITVEVLVNIGMNIRLMPVTGIPLPFLSAGGTTLLTNALCLGVAQSIMLRYKRLTF